MTQAISRGDFHQADRINKQLSDIHLNQVLKVAEKKTQYEMRKEVCFSRSNHAIEESEVESHAELEVGAFTRLHRRFNRKERWERKGNSSLVCDKHAHVTKHNASQCSV